MSCFTTYDANGNPVHNYVGDVTVDLTSASNGGAAFVAPPCNDPPPGTPIVVQDTTPPYTMHMSVSGQSTPASAPQPGALALLVIGLVALRMNRAHGKRSVLSREHDSAQFVAVEKPRPWVSRNAR